MSTSDDYYKRVEIRGLNEDITILKATNHSGRNSRAIEILTKRRDTLMAEVAASSKVASGT